MNNPETILAALDRHLERRRQLPTPSALSTSRDDQRSTRQETVFANDRDPWQRETVDLPSEARPCTVVPDAQSNRKPAGARTR